MRHALFIAVLFSFVWQTSAEITIDRTGQPTTVVRVDEPTTVRELGHHLRLNPDEAHAWLTLTPAPDEPLTADSPLTPGFVETHRPAVPNTAVFHLGSATRWSTLAGLGPPREAFAVFMLRQARREAQAKRDAGYHVVFHESATADDTRHALTNMTHNGTLAELSFFGHGDRGIINTTGDPLTGVLPKRHTAYGLPRLALHTCGSLHPAGSLTLTLDIKGNTRRLPPNTASHWQFNVAPHGQLVGYPQQDVTPITLGLTLTLPGLRPHPKFTPKPPAARLQAGVPAAIPPR
ncbi:MAG: hypothetical protein AAF710_00050 [Planctomycetota bacterium]